MKAKIALVGTGWWATHTHLPALRTHIDAEIVAVCDIDHDKAQRAAAAFAIPKVYTNLQEMLLHEHLDGVMVATYHATHYAVAKTILSHQLHVYIEKPMVLYAPEAAELVTLAKSNSKEIVMGYNHNHNSFVSRAQDLILNGDIGEIQYVTGQFSQAIFGLLAGRADDVEGTLYNPGNVYSDPERSGGGQGHLQITHLAGMLFLITGLRIQQVQALMHNCGLNVDVVNAMMVQFDNGALGNFGGTGNTRHSRCFKLTVYESTGWIDIDDAAGTMIVRRDNHDPEVHKPADGAEHVHPMFAPTHNFVDVILGKAKNQSSGLIGWRAVELLDAAYRSASAAGRPVRLDELY